MNGMISTHSADKTALTLWSMLLGPYWSPLPLRLCHLSHELLEIARRTSLQTSLVTIWIQRAHTHLSSPQPDVSHSESLSVTNRLHPSVTRARNSSGWSTYRCRSGYIDSCQSSLSASLDERIQTRGSPASSLCSFPSF